MDKMTRRKKIQLYTITFIIIIVSLFSLTDNPWHLVDDWKTATMVSLIALLMINFVYLNHYTHKGYGQKHSDDFFNFPLEFITAMATVAFILQIVFEMQRSARHDTLINKQNLSLYTDTVVVKNWEADATKYPQLNELYEEIFSKPSGSKGGFMTKEAWEKKFPDIAHIPYEGNEEKWHYAAKFCQQMINVVRMFNLNTLYKIEIAGDKDLILHSPYAGWISEFRAFMQNPLIRNVWEQYKYRHVNPQFSAWVQYYIIDEVDSKKDIFKTHNKRWNQEVNDLLSGKEVPFNYLSK